MSKKGRPCKPKDMLHPHIVMVRMTDEQFAKMTAAAELTGVHRAVYIRTRVVSAATADIQRLTQTADTRRALSLSQGDPHGVHR